VPVSERTFKQVALEDPEGHWELVCGRLQPKPGMTAEHNDLSLRLAYYLMQQLDRNAFRVRHDSAHVRRAAESYYIPDVFVIPADLERAQRGTHQLESYQAPLPLVVEVWSPSTGDFDVRVKVREYQGRGDLEVWLVHPYEHTLTSWRRTLDGSYVESTFSHGTVQPVALRGVTIDLDALFT
jgi:Uma2 family endonuclease